MTKDTSPIHKCVSEIKNLLEKNGMSYDYLEHEPVRTSEEAARVRPDKYTLSQGAKALIVRIRQYGGKKYFCMLVVPGDKRFDFAKTKELFQAKDIRFATEEEVADITEGVKVGGVPPFGNLFGLKVYTDKKVFDNNKVIFNAGDKRVSIAIDVADYQKLVKSEILDLT